MPDLDRLIPDEKDRQGPRDGGSRTFDLSGRLIEVNGKPVVGSKPPASRKLARKPRSSEEEGDK